MAEGVQINPRIKLATKARLEAFRKERGASQGEVIEAALEAYFAPTDGDTQTLLFQKVNELGQGMKDVVTLLGTVIQHLERQAKPPPPKIATRDELYPELTGSAARMSRGRRRHQRVEEAPAPPPRSSWRALFSRRTNAMTPTPPPIWGYMTDAHHWFQHASTGGVGRAGGAVCGGARLEDAQAPGAPGPHVAWLGPVGHRARGEEDRAVPGPWRGAGGDGRRCLDG